MQLGERRRMSGTTFKEPIRKYRTYIIALLMFPVTGMVAALGIVAWRPPKNVFLVVTVIFFLMVQYAVNVFFNNEEDRLVLVDRSTICILSRSSTYICVT
jgi:4-hydroxybenzoate polyprenyltransferase